ncbi:hypothetical protein [Rhizobium sp. BR 315]|uniref:hypothetical protein n=1 Tax=Rhizobium sp. BR 315 TaxID=3040014 RepID=UPI003D340675
MTQIMVTESYIGRMIGLHAAIDALGAEFCPMPDEAMSALTEASMLISKAIIAAPVTSEADIANKFRFAAALIECPHGLMADEPAAVFGALADLARFRNGESLEIFGEPDCWYGHISGLQRQ